MNDRVAEGFSDLSISTFIEAVSDIVGVEQVVAHPYFGAVDFQVRITGDPFEVGRQIESKLRQRRRGGARFEYTLIGWPQMPVLDADSIVVFERSI